MKIPLRQLSFLLFLGLILLGVSLSGCTRKKPLLPDELPPPVAAAPSPQAALEAAPPVAARD